MATNTGGKVRGGWRVTSWPQLLLTIALTLLRIWAGIIWIGQLGWKAPWSGAGGFGCPSPRFGGTPAGGLCDWMQREADHPALGLYGDFVRNIVIPNFDFFAWLTIFTEAFIGYALLFGILTRLAGFVGFAWAVTLVIGLAAVPGEDLAYYIPYVVVPLVFMVIGSRWQFSVDGLLANRYQEWASKSRLGQFVNFLSGPKAGNTGLERSNS